MYIYMYSTWINAYRYIIGKHFNAYLYMYAQDMYM